ATPSTSTPARERAARGSSAELAERLLDPPRERAELALAGPGHERGLDVDPPSTGVRTARLATSLPDGSERSSGADESGPRTTARLSSIGDFPFGGWCATGKRRGSCVDP